MFQRLSLRERRVVGAGAAVSLVSLLFAFVILPQAQRLADREASIEVRSEQLARLRGVIAAEPGLRDELEALREELASVEPQLLEGGTAAVAASNLQLLLNQYVTEAGLELERVDAAGQAGDLGGLQRIPARISVRGETPGLVYLLARLHESAPFLSIDELRISVQAPRPGDPETLMALISLHGYAFAGEAGA